MGNLFLVILIGISLSMDAFSLSIIYGTYGISSDKAIILSIVVGIFHFIMPLLGLCFGNIIMKYFLFSINLIVGSIFFVIGISMILSSIREDDIKILTNMLGFLLFGLSVSIDSFTVGIGIGFISHNYLMVSSIFMVISGLLTYIGLSFGKNIGERLGKYSDIMGGGIMIMLGIYYLFKIVV